MAKLQQEYCEKKPTKQEYWWFFRIYEEEDGGQVTSGSEVRIDRERRKVWWFLG